MNRYSLVLVSLAFIAAASSGCKSSKRDGASSATTSGEKGAAKDAGAVSTGADAVKVKPRDRSAMNALVSMAEESLANLESLEVEADVTCWTSFRQLDWYIAEKTYSEFAAVAKVTAIKGLTRALWVKASKLAAGKPVTAQDIESALSSLPALEVASDKRSELTGFANDIGLRNYTDYQKTAEHWRVVLAVIQDEIFFGSGSDKVSPISGDALVAFADGSTKLSLHLLKRASAAAEQRRKDEIEADDVKSGFTELAKELGLTNLKRNTSPLSHTESITIISPLTQKLIEGKGKALLSFNRATGKLETDLSRVSELPLTAEAAQVFYAAALSFVRFATSGADPMRGDNYLADGNFEETVIANTPYLKYLQLHNVIAQSFPHNVLANGDVVVRFEPNPGPMTVGKIDLTPFEIRMLDHRMNGVRDSAIHWKAMADVFTRRRFAIDPFAAEYLAEVVSMMVTLNIERAVKIAKAAGAKTVDGATAKRVIASRAFVQVPIEEDKRPAWNKEHRAEKKVALRKVGSRLFADVTKGSGLPTKVVAKELKPSAQFNIQQIMGGGVAVGDVDRDGYPDIYLAGDGLGRLLLNRGKAAPGEFSDATTAWKLPEVRDSHGALLFDLEGDGDLDLVVLSDRGRSRLFRQTKGRFEDATKSLGFSPGAGAHSAHVFDYDGDGDLDLYIGKYGALSFHKDNSKPSVPSLDGRNGSPNQLWRNDGDKLTEVASKAGLADVGWTLAIGSFDYEQDGDLDLYLANDFGANALYRNLGGGRFEDATAMTGTGDRGSGMNVEFTDFNRDGFWDLYVTNIDMFSKRIKVVFPRDESTIDLDQELAESFQYLSGNKLYASSGKGSFRSAEEGAIEPGDRGWGWDALFFDYENDGDDDLYLSNGWVDGSYAGNQKNQMFVFEGVYHLAPPGSPEAVAGNTRSVAAADFDRDGDIDLVLNQFHKAPVMLENVQRSKNRWVRVKLVGTGKNPDAIGAQLVATHGDRKIMKQVSGGRGYISQTETELLVGIGSATQVDIEVRWPGGKTTMHKGLAHGARHELKAEKAK